MTTGMTDQQHAEAITEQQEWSVEDASDLYGVEAWSNGYFGVSERGTMLVYPDADPGRSIDLHEVAKLLERRGVDMPVLVRFPALLHRRAEELRAAFDAAIKAEDYTGGFACVYPIKVNQQRHIVEVVRDAAARQGFGLEAGSKPELMAVLGVTADHPEMPIICNGFKDADFVELIILASKLGRRIIPVVEKLTELEHIIDQAERHNVRPTIGVRVKLSSPGIGKWASSVGTKSKFGLNISDLLDAVEVLAERDMADCLKLLHCHLGSQICDIRHMKNALSELTHIYCELVRLGAGMETLDIGGGLAVDYDGTRSNAESSMNYTLSEYALDVVYRIRSSCDEAGVKHPNIVTESGRAMLAYSSALLFDVAETTSPDWRGDVQQSEIEKDDNGELPQPILDLLDARSRVGTPNQNALSILHDAAAARDEMLVLFGHGYVTLPQRAAAERLFWSIGRSLLRYAAGVEDENEEFAALADQLSDLYICNMSVFQSMPDAWAIDQVFPIVPIQRLDEEPDRLAVLHDITCDSDGKVNRYVCGDGIRKSLPVHAVRPGERYILGAFLVGAYQEILGDLHNLFGDNHAVSVRLDEKGRTRVDTFVEGDTVREVLQYVQMDPERLCEAMERDAERAADDGALTPEEAAAVRNHFRVGMNAYTYLRHDPPATQRRVES
jgi:arginine decarboxylase